MTGQWEAGVQTWSRSGTQVSRAAGGEVGTLGGPDRMGALACIAEGDPQIGFSRSQGSGLRRFPLTHPLGGYKNPHF